MAGMTIALGDYAARYVEEQLGEDFANADAFIAELIRRDQAENAELRTIVDEAMAGGESDRTVNEIFEEVVRLAKANGTHRD